MKRSLPLLSVLTAVVLPVALRGAEAGDPEVTFGGDLRLRYEAANNLPTSTHGEKGHTDYLRLRTRVWGRATAGRLSAFLRVADEFRYYNSRESDKGKQRFPDVVFIDSLYLQYAGLFDMIDAKVGRQDMAFGARRIISDGTGGDGSRTAYFDAVRLTFDFGGRRTLDAFAVYQARHDWLPTLGETHAAKSSGRKGFDYETSGYDHTEYGAGLYWQDRGTDAFGWDAYYVWKAEDGRRSRAIAESGLSRDTFYTHTAGFRLLPRFTETLSGEAEFALQAGTDSLFAAMAYGGLTYAPGTQWNPTLTAGVHWLSGDRDGWRGRHAWHAVFNRETGYGDTIAPMFDTYAYTNFLYPHLRLTLEPAEAHRIACQTGPVFAPVAEADGEGGTYGHFRGYYVQAEYRVDVGAWTGSDALKGLSAALLGEFFSKGDTFGDGEDGDALFGRFELSYCF